MRYIIHGHTYGEEFDELIGMVKEESEIQAKIDADALDQNRNLDEYVAEVWDIETCEIIDYIRDLHATE